MSCGCCDEDEDEEAPTKPKLTPDFSNVMRNLPRDPAAFWLNRYVAALSRDGFDVKLRGYSNRKPALEIRLASRLGTRFGGYNKNFIRRLGIVNE